MAVPDTSDEQRFAGALLARAEGDRHRSLQEATEEAQRLQQEAENQIAHLRAERLQVAARRARERIDHQLSEIRQRQRAEEARLVDEARARVMEAASRQLAALRKRPDYIASLRHMLDDAINEFGTGTGLMLTIDDRDREHVADVLRNRGLNEIEVVAGGPFLVGFQVITLDGKKMIDHTFDARLFARLSSIHVQVARIFAQSD